MRAQKTKGIKIMKRHVASGLSVVILAIVISIPGQVRAQQADVQEDNGIFVLGSVLFSILHVPLKLATCVGTQATAAVAYTATFGVPGHYDGGLVKRRAVVAPDRGLSRRRKSKVTTGVSSRLELETNMNLVRNVPLRENLTA